MLVVLNVGGGGGHLAHPAFKGWQQKVLDIDASVKPDICLDARRMGTLPGGEYDGIYCGHTLEHFYEHEVPGVLAGFHHILKPAGFALVVVPDLQMVFDELSAGAGLGAVWYMAGPIPVTYHDALFGWSYMMRQGNLYFAHKCGFTEDTLALALRKSGFASVYVQRDNHQLFAYGFKRQPSKARLERMLKAA